MGGRERNVAGHERGRRGSAAGVAVSGGAGASVDWFGGHAQLLRHGAALAEEGAGAGARRGREAVVGLRQGDREHPQRARGVPASQAGDDGLEPARLPAAHRGQSLSSSAPASRPSPLPF